MGRRYNEKNVWDKKLTVHLSISERVNFILTRLAVIKGVSKGKLVEEYLLREPEILEDIEKVKKEGYIDF